MIYLIAHLHVLPGQELAFQTYEKTVLPIFKEYGGKVLQALRPLRPMPSSHSTKKVATKKVYTGTQADRFENEVPYEIHVLSIPSESALAAYRNDPRIANLSTERNRIMQKTDIVISKELVIY